jgi:hypothetical protein
VSTSSTVATQQLGTLNESVMGLYGLSRLLHARELGPAKLLPSVRTNLDDLQRCHDQADSWLTQIVGTLPPALVAVAKQAAEQVGDVLERAIVELRTAADSRLGAARRLSLEREVQRSSAELEQLRNLLELLIVASDPTSPDLCCADVLRGRWAAPPLVVDREVELWLRFADGESFNSNPRALYGVLIWALKKLAGPGFEGGTRVLLTSRVLPEGCQTELRRLDGDEPAPDCDHRRVSLGPSLAIEDAVVPVVAEALAIGIVEPAPEQIVVIP